MNRSELSADGSGIIIINDISDRIDFSYEKIIIDYQIKPLENMMVCLLFSVSERLSQINKFLISPWKYRVGMDQEKIIRYGFWVQAGL